MLIVVIITVARIGVVTITVVVEMVATLIAQLLTEKITLMGHSLLMLNRDFLGLLLPSGRKAALAFVLFAL